MLPSMGFPPGAKGRSAGGCLPGVPGFLQCSGSPRGFAAAELRLKETWDPCMLSIWDSRRGLKGRCGWLRFEWGVTWNMGVIH